MKNKAKNWLSISLFALLLTPFFAFADTPAAKTTAFNELAKGIGLFLGFVKNDIIFPIRNDYCRQYGDGLKSGEWQEGDLRSKVGKRFCAGFTPTPNQAAIAGTSTFSLPDFSVTGFSFPNFSLPKLVMPTSALPGSEGTSSQAPASGTSTESLPGTLVGSTEENGVSLNPSQIEYWTNIERHNNGDLPGLENNTLLASLAKIRVDDMFAKQYFEHVSPSGDNISKEAKAHGYDYITIGENIALGNFGSSRDLVTAWMNSPGHRANILNGNYVEIGVYAAQGTYQGNQVWIAAQIFGKPLGNCTGPDAALKQKIASEQAEAKNTSANLATMKAELDQMDSSNADAYNAKASAYNVLAKQYNTLVADIKSLTTTYNQEVNAFNACIKTN